MRAILKATVEFGRVGIPVGLGSTHVAGGVKFRDLHRECNTPLEQRRHCPHEDRQVEPDEIVKGWEAAPGKFAVVEPEELAAIAPDGSDRAIAIFSFVPREEIDPVDYDKAYFLAPGEHEIGRRSYALLSGVLRETETAALARFVAWGAEQLCAIEAHSEDEWALALRTLRFAEDRVATAELEELLAGADPSDEEFDLARELAMKLFVPYERADLTSHHRPQVKQLLEAKLAGRKIVRPAARESERQIALPSVDLAGALKKSIRETRRPGRARPKAAVKV